MRDSKPEISVGVLITVACVFLGNPVFAQPFDTGWFTQIFVRECMPPANPGELPICSGANPTLVRVGDFDLAADGDAQITHIEPDLSAQSSASVGYDGPGFPPKISIYSYSAVGQRIIASAFGFQKYTFENDDPLTGSAVFTYSQTGQAPSQASRNPRGVMAGGITAFQMAGDVFDPTKCPAFVAQGGDISAPGAGVTLLICLLNGTFADVSNFQNDEFNPAPIEATDAMETVEFAINGQAGETWFLTGDLFVFASNGGFADSRTTLTINLDNPEVVEASFAEETFSPAPPLTVGSDIDIKPGGEPNAVNPRSKGLIPVAVLGSTEFDTGQIDPGTVAFGSNDASAAHNGHIQDVNDDGFYDMIFHFRIRNTGIACGDTEATLTGEDVTGVPFTGTDSIKTVGCK